MVWTIKGRRLLDGRAAGGLVVSGAALAAILAAAAAAARDGVAPSLLALQAIALACAGHALIESRRARRVAEKASSDLDIVAGRLIQLEQRLLQTAGGASDRGLRSTVAEVTGEIGLLGGIVRDLAETIAAQDRDVADLKDQIRRAEIPASLPSSRAAPEPPLAQAARGVAVQPDPSLLPAPRKEPAVSETEARRVAAILQAFEADRIELHLQPIVALPQRKVRFYETLARLKLADETILVPAEFLPLLERLGHAAEFDRRVIGRGIAIARHLMARGSEAIVSINVSPRSLDEPGFLRSVGRIVDAYPDTIGRLVLEFSQRCWRTLDAERAGGLAALRDRGVPFALDRATDLRLDPLALADRGVRFVKVPADLMLAADQNRGLDIEMGDLASVLRRAGIRLVAERVEQEEMVPDLIDLDVPLGQGFVFSAPRAVRAEVLAAPISGDAQASGPAPPDDEPPAPEPGPGGERLPFRSFLRRAG
jgi:cyclic-di-GMP phosphodiesterase TipF (flagellum assembly factor)